MTRNPALEHIEGARTYLPPANHVIVRLAKAERTRGGILLPQTAMEESASGEVVAIGEFAELIKAGPCPAKLGDSVCFSRTVVPVHAIDDAYVVFEWALIWLVVRMGKHAGGVFCEPAGQASANGGVEVIEGV